MTIFRPRRRSRYATGTWWTAARGWFGRSPGSGWRGVDLRRLFSRIFLLPAASGQKADSATRNKGNAEVQSMMSFRHSCQGLPAEDRWQNRSRATKPNNSQCDGSARLIMNSRRRVASQAKADVWRTHTKWLQWIFHGRILTDLRQKRGQLAFSLLRRSVAPAFFGGKGSSPRFWLLFAENQSRCQDAPICHNS